MYTLGGRKARRKANRSYPPNSPRHSIARALLPPLLPTQSTEAHYFVSSSLFRRDTRGERTHSTLQVSCILGPLAFAAEQKPPRMMITTAQKDGNQRGKNHTRPSRHATKGKQLLRKTEQFARRAIAYESRTKNQGLSKKKSVTPHSPLPLPKQIPADTARGATVVGAAAARKEAGAATLRTALRNIVSSGGKHCPAS